MTYQELKKLFCLHEAENPTEHLTAHIVFSSFGSNGTTDSSAEARTYVVSSDNKAFQPNKGGYSIFGGSLDNSDTGVRLESYMKEERGGPDGWVVENCCLVSTGEEKCDGNATMGAAEWQPYSDDASNYSYIRQLQENYAYEVVHVRQNKEEDTASFTHKVVFVEDYSVAELEEILSDFGYASLADFMEENFGSEARAACMVDGAIDRSRIEWMHLAALLAEHDDGCAMSVAEAEAHVKRILAK